MNNYKCTFDQIEWYLVTLNGETFDPAPSLAIRNHSPDGFAWGYHGSGPAQFALAILLQETGDKAFAEQFYQDFKRAFVAGLKNNTDHEFDSEALRPYLEAYYQKRSDEIGNTKQDRMGW